MNYRKLLFFIAFSCISFSSALPLSASAATTLGMAARQRAVIAFLPAKSCKLSCVSIGCNISFRYIGRDGRGATGTS